MNAEAPAALLARELVTALVSGGVRHVVLAPGSRSAPLAYALLAAHDAGWLRLHVRVDERVAGFVALGLARADGVPAAVVTTSGTAVANLHPAVLEAAHSGVPLVVLSADRPHELRRTGASQTTDQVGLFAAAPRWEADLPADTPPAASRQLVVRALAAASGARSGDPGPVHLNVAFRDPLVPGAAWRPGEPPARRDVVAVRGPGGTVDVPAGGRTVVVAGDGAGPVAARLAEAGGWPLLAEPTSGARTGSHAVAAYRLLLTELGEEVERVLVLGHPTLSRPVSALLARPDVDVVVVAPTGAVWPDVAGTAARVAGGVRVLPGDDDGEWLARWQRSGAAAERVLAAHGELDGLGVARAVAAAAAAAHAEGGRETLVLGSSMTVRDWDLAVPALPEGMRVVANRGLAGIDGTVATATGLALATGGAVRAVLGDLTFLHDAGALLRGTLEEEVDLQVVLLNDRGGAIFATLEHGAPERAATFERVFGTPQEVDVAALCAGYGVRHTAVGGLEELGAVLTAPVAGRSVVEVVLDRSELRQQRERLAARVSDAVRREQAPGA
ncbi:2-succinyl-5-enolpyruvyl-6-hydroxy-3-cyclohexene-1-carboxylate synthase [Georgenia satyanarayanai]|uniref:2-succinyl-5-enolpyruvyl-6-hydroxy-3-cyclohexene-1-carboxylate synthase n=1 Tax=Georgenia satyanarayanai TaxID=860221 RepID=A0A2Y9AE16_9MICO|nr:2-succinyl-5-enolpyruvyl-6-hydroxy-3-cyclohexene-1-carboxylic-acid synthase [Georgenia satyanarayanai]PYF99580.1 2-succinyl-5-enolpyruvyl-6-hydroxy-3-cyclohexene-1-carboxylate synthase [Georgenia satyanarayanai]SSA42425.1 2-succinyl-5-enolpyruvyl-6-hydroxy-3-cyclohexene-1-carboxylate synthase [Georgenia satyanarayanai]